MAVAFSARVSLCVCVSRYVAVFDYAKGHSGGRDVDEGAADLRQAPTLLPLPLWHEDESLFPILNYEDHPLAMEDTRHFRCTDLQQEAPGTARFNSV